MHIVRDPYAVFPSTVGLWKRLYRDEGWRFSKYGGLDEHVLKTLTRMYDAFERDRELLGQNQFCQVRYEDLVADPVREMRSVYGQLGLGDFEPVRPAIEAYFSGQKNYQTNRYQLTPEAPRRDHPPLGQVHRALRLRAGGSRHQAGGRAQLNAAARVARPKRAKGVVCRCRAHHLVPGARRNRHSGRSEESCMESPR